MSLNERQRASTGSYYALDQQRFCVVVDYDTIVVDARDQLYAATTEPDQMTISDSRIINWFGKKKLLMSAFLGKVRLIDNQVVDFVSEQQN